MLLYLIIIILHNSDIKIFRENKINLILNADVDLIHLIIGFNIPIIKSYNDKNSEELTKELMRVTQLMKENR